MTLTEFLEQRIGEDEAVAREVQAKVAQAEPYAFEDAEGSQPSAYFDMDYRQGGFTITSARVLAECASKRRLVGRALDLIASFGDWDAAEAIAAGGSGQMWEDVNRRERSQAHDTLALLALPYADHPDYDEAWRP